MDRYTDDLKVLRAATKKGPAISWRILLWLALPVAALCAFFTLCVPARVWLLSTKADWEVATGDKQSALADFQSALALDPKNIDLMEETGSMFERNGEESKAYLIFDKLLSVRSKHESAVRHMAEVNLRLKRYPEALGYAKQWVEQEPKSAAAWRARGRAFDGLKKFDEAVADYDKSLSIDPQSEAAIDKSEMQQQQRVQHHTFEYLVEPTFSNKPNDYEATVADALRYATSFKPAESAAAFERAIKLNPTSPKAYLIRGVTSHSYHRFEQAEKDYLICEKLWKGNEPIVLNNASESHTTKSTFYNEVAENYISLNKFEKALHYSDLALAIAPHSPRYLRSRAYSLQRLGRNKEAREAVAAMKKAQRTEDTMDPRLIMSTSPLPNSK